MRLLCTQYNCYGPIVTQLHPDAGGSRKKKWLHALDNMKTKSGEVKCNCASEKLAIKANTSIAENLQMHEPNDFNWIISGAII